MVHEPKRSLAAYDGGEIVGAAAAFTMTLTIPGGELPMAGVTAVGVAATHRRRGILTEVMRRLFADGALGGADACAVHEHVHAAKLFDGERNCSLSIRLGGDIGLRKTPAELACELLAKLDLHVGDDHFAAVLCRHARSRRAETRSAAGDEENAVLDLHRVLPAGIR